MHDAFLERFLPGDAFGPARRAIWIANQDSAIAIRQPLLFLGEPGAGKTYAARLAAAHRQWRRQPPKNRDLYLREKNWPALILTKFGELSLPTLPANLVESELFGHMKGAFTGAERDKEGIFGSQTVEDVLLDEIGDVVLEVQPKLLQVIQSGTFRPVGGRLEDMKETGCRVLMATNRDLARMVELKDFREDLFWRISQIVVEVPPLRSHPEDIPVLMASVRETVIREMAEVDIACAHHAEARHFTNDDLKWAKAHAWPGNTREVERLARLWLIEPDQLAFSEIANRYPLSQPREPTSNAEGLLRLGVQSWVREATTGIRKPPGTIGGIIKDMERILRVALTELKLTREELEWLFPDQVVDNVRSRMSRYKSGPRKGGK